MEGANPLAEGSISLTVNGSLWIEAKRSSGEYKWQIPCTRHGKDTELCLSFRPEFLIDAIKAYPADRAIFQTGDSYGLCLINGKAAVMPLRV